MYKKIEHPGTLTVSNFEQKIILLTEMIGQISDGFWESSTPNGHWQVWSHLRWDNIQVGEDVGRDFPVIRSTYSFASVDLIEVVGERTAFAVRFGLLYPEAIEKLIRADINLPDTLSDAEIVFNSTEGFWETRKQRQSDQLRQAQ